MSSSSFHVRSPLERLLVEFSKAAAEVWLGSAFPGFERREEPLEMASAVCRNAGCTEGFRLGSVCLTGPSGGEVELPVFWVTCARLGRGPQRKAQFLCAQELWRYHGQGTGEAPVAGALFFFRASGERRTRFSLVTSQEAGDKTLYRRQSFLLESGEGRSRTFRKCFGQCRVTEFGTAGSPSVRGARDTLLGKFSVEALTKEFYDKLYAWYEWAAKPATGVRFPDAAGDGARLREHLIRLITRLMFVWFVKEKIGALGQFFNEAWLREHLRAFEPTSARSGTYYNAVLQNLFFATLNQPAEARAFASARAFQGRAGDYGVNTLFRDASEHEGGWFSVGHERILEAFAAVPYLNGGLFECLDGEDEAGRKVYRDGFSRNPTRRAFLPDILFFDPARGLIPLLARYGFTIDENHATDADIALDPGLLGKVFERLLATYNPETGASARKASGSFYTPREIVDYMVDEALRAALVKDFPEEILGALFGGHAETLPPDVRRALAERLRTLRTLDPACGSGAFPMGLLNRMVDLLESLEGAAEETYRRKLHLIQSCIYGVDIQPIAIQIAKLRFFISLLCDQTVNPGLPNAGLEQLPNLETHLVIANALVGIEGADDYLPTAEITHLRDELRRLRDRHLRLHSRREKLALRREDRTLRQRLQAALSERHLRGTDLLAEWDPYNPCASSPFFDAEWMFGFKTFDLVIGNPPYVQVKKGIFQRSRYPFSEGKDKGKQNLYKVFIEAGYNMASPGGAVCLIVQNALMCDLSSIATRELLLRKTSIRQFVQFPESTDDPELKVFKSVTMGTCIVVFQKLVPHDASFRLSIHNTLQTIVSLRYTQLSQSAILEGKHHLEIPLIREGEGELFLKMRTEYRTLDTILCGQRQGNINTIHLNRILSPVPTSISIGKGEKIHRYALSDDLMWAKETSETRALAQDNARDYPVISQNITCSTGRWRIHACRAECKKRRILFLDSANITYLPSPRMALLTVGLLNSRLLDWVFRTTSTNNHVNLYELVALPIPSEEALASPTADMLVNYVEWAEQGEDCQEMIDSLVYRLYGLTMEESVLVERAYDSPEEDEDEDEDEEEEDEEL